MTFVSCIPQAIDCKLIENKQINVALLMMFQNEIDIFKCGEISNHTQETSINMPKKESNVDEEKINLISVIPL